MPIANCPLTPQQIAILGRSAQQLNCRPEGCYCNQIIDASSASEDLKNQWKQRITTDNFRICMQFQVVTNLIGGERILEAQEEDFYDDF